MIDSSNVFNSLEEKMATQIRTYLQDNMLVAEYGELFDRAYIGRIEVDKIADGFAVYIEVGLNKKAEFIPNKSIAKIVCRYIKRTCRKAKRFSVLVENGGVKELIVLGGGLNGGGKKAN